MSFEKEYGTRLEDILSYLATSKRLINSMTGDLLDSIDISLLLECLKVAPYFPSEKYPRVEGDNWPYTNQALLYVGYLRGFSDCIDDISAFVPVGCVYHPSDNPPDLNDVPDVPYPEAEVKSDVR